MVEIQYLIHLLQLEEAPAVAVILKEQMQVQPAAVVAEQVVTEHTM